VWHFESEKRTKDADEVFPVLTMPSILPTELEKVNKQNSLNSADPTT
jgi:hypothetical protein